MAAPGGRTGKKAKQKSKKTLNLSEFLGKTQQQTPDGKAIVKISANWADEMDSYDRYDSPDVEKVVALPTAPRASREVDLDLSQLPDRPPYTVFVGNLSYDVEEDDLMIFFRNLEVSNIRLPRDGGRLKGFGYVEFNTKDSVAEAMKLNDELLCNRKIRIDISMHGDSRSGQEGFGPKDNSKWGGGESFLAESDDNWRGGAMRGGDDMGPPRRLNRHGDSDGQWGRDGGGMVEENDGPWRRGARGVTSEGPWGGPPEVAGNDDGPWRRGPGEGGFGRRPGGEGLRGTLEEPRPSEEDNNWRKGGGMSGPHHASALDDPFPRRGGSGFGESFGPSRREGHWGSGGGRPFDEHDRRGGGFEENRRDHPVQERPRLALQPRSKPIEEPTECTSGIAAERDGKSTEAHGGRSAGAPSTTSSAIFGGARPVDTAARERMLEIKPKDGEKSLASGKPTKASIFGTAKPVDTAAKEKAIEEKLKKLEVDSSNAREGGSRRFPSPGGGLRTPERKWSPRRPSPGRRSSPDRRRYSPDRRGYSPDRRRCSPDRRRYSPDRRRYSPDRRRYSPDRRRYSPSPTNESPGQRYSSGRQGYSSDRQGHSPDRRSHSSGSGDRSPDHKRSSPRPRCGSPEQHKPVGHGVGGNLHSAGSRENGSGGPSRYVRELPKSIEDMPKYTPQANKDLATTNKFASLLGATDELEDL